LLTSAGIFQAASDTELKREPNGRETICSALFFEKSLEKRLQFSIKCDIIPMFAKRKFHILYGEVLKWGRLRALPVADKASKKEWQRSKFGEC
jgi:hypothetical protein